MNEATRRRPALAETIGTSYASIGLMAIKPAGLAARLKQAFRIEPAAAVGALKELIEETLALVRTHVPGFDTTPYRVGPARRQTIEPARAQRRGAPRS